MSLTHAKAETATKIIEKTGSTVPQSKKVDIPQPATSPFDHVLYLQRTIGNQAVQRLIKSGSVQAKLKTSQSNNVYEKEADREADSTMHISPLLRKKKTSSSDSAVIPRNEPKVNNFNNNGSPLPESDRKFFEQCFGYDFGDVRVHFDSQAAESASAMKALAYTVGNDIVLGAGQYELNTNEGRLLIAHELAHVVQQSSSVSSQPSLSVGKSTEREAETAANQAVLGLKVGLTPCSQVPPVQFKSLSAEYEEQIMSNLNKGNYVRGYLWTLLYTAHDALTFGFLSAHDPAYDAYESGRISEDEYLKATLKATGRSVAIGTATVLTGGVAGAAGEGVAVGLGAGARAAMVVGSTVGGGAAGGVGQLTGDLYDIAAGDKEGLSSKENYMVAIGLGAAGGLATGGTTAAATKFKVFQSSAARMGGIYSQRFPRSTKLLSAIRQTTAQRTAGLAVSMGARAETVAQMATKELARARASGKSVMVNIGGKGEVEGAINLNPNISSVEKDPAWPNWVPARGEAIGDLFPANSLDAIYGSKLPTDLDWVTIASGAQKTLKPGGEISISVYGSAETVATALRNAGFKAVKVTSNVLVEAVK